jgi:hypothetical protein
LCNRLKTKDNTEVASPCVDNCCLDDNDIWAQYDGGPEVQVTHLVFWSSQDYGIASMDLFQRDSAVTGVSVANTNIQARLEGTTALGPVEVSPAMI